MSYVINSSLLDIDYRKQHIHALLDLYLAGKDYSRSPVWEWAIRTLKRGDWWYGIETLPEAQRDAAIQRRQKEIIDLYHSIKTHGYNGSIISVYFDKVTGQVHTYDGYHRLSVMEYLGISADVNCRVSHHHPDPSQRGDFPLEQRLQELANGQKYLYQPCEDPRVQSWGVWRPDSQARLESLLPYDLIGNSILDVGCSTGWFSRQLARRRYEVTALETNPKALAIARYLGITQNCPVILKQESWQQYMPGKYYDNVLMLSILHHDILQYGVERVIRDLGLLKGCCKRLIVEMPLSAKSVSWLSEERKNDWDFSIDEFTDILADACGLQLVKVYYVHHKDRPFIVLGRGELK